MQEIASDNVSNMVEHSAILHRINENEQRAAWLPWIGYGITLIATISQGMLGLIIGGLVIAGTYALRHHLIAESPVELDYQLDEEDSRKHEILTNALGNLESCRRVWRINAITGTDDWKRNAGANQLVRRSNAMCGNGTARSFSANIRVPHIIAGKETLYFLPDMILVKQGNQFGSLSYTNLQIANSVTRFNEQEGVPSDAQVLGRTWRYVNKKGGPDRRFNNNHEIPVVAYGEIGLRSDSGLRFALMTSSSVAAERLVAGLRAVQSFKSVEMMYLQTGESVP